MAILNFIKPDKVFMINSTEMNGQFEFRPLEPGYGLTVGNALRRVLLSSLEGFAISSIKIDGVNHEFSAIEGVVEDVVSIILNLKQIRLKKQIEDILGIDTSDAILVSAKTGEGIKELLEQIVIKMPSPKGDQNKPLKSLLVDSWFDSYLGVIVLVRVIDGTLKNLKMF